MVRVGQNHVYTVCIRYLWQGNHQIYGHIRCMYTVLANPTNGFIKPEQESIRPLTSIRHLTTHKNEHEHVLIYMNSALVHLGTNKLR